MHCSLVTRQYCLASIFALSYYIFTSIALLMDMDGKREAEETGALCRRILVLHPIEELTLHALCLCTTVHSTYKFINSIETKEKLRCRSKEKHRVYSMLWYVSYFIIENVAVRALRDLTSIWRWLLTIERIG